MRTIEPLIKLDLALSTYCLRHRTHSSLTTVSKAISHTGDGHLYLLLGLLAWGLDGNYGRQFFLIGIFAFAMELPIYWIVKNAVQRRRPQDYSPRLTAAITPSDRYSLPSGHTAAAFLMATLIGYFYPSLYPVALIWAGLIGGSRIVLCVHFLTDVVAGALLGYLSVVMAVTILGSGLL